MGSEPATANEELGSSTDRVDELERASAERIAQVHRALAAAQDRYYWLDRWGIDLNALMRKRGAAEARAAFRGVRAVFRIAKEMQRRSEGARSVLSAERGDSGADAAYLPSRTLSPDRLTASPVTDLLYAKLDPSDVAAVEEQLGAAHSALWETADERDRRRLTLAFAADLNLERALERTGLSAAMPAPGVHTMAQGPAAAGGSTYYADIVADALAETDMALRPGMMGLDFGCSSGRVVRVLAAAYPEIAWHGCDPIPDAIEWAAANLPGIGFERSPEYPPLSFEDDSFDFAFAISIWSHFSEAAALDWLREMRRIIRPGGRLLITTHGDQTIAHTHSEGVRSLRQLAEVRESLFERGFWYAAEFGEAGDHGIANPDWGTAFLSAEWLLGKLTPEWHVAFFRPGRVEANQDVYVLERR
jgi:SAM-dependent methyltransferase